MEKIEDISNFRDGINTILHGDGVALLMKIPEKSIDLVCIDPPYVLSDSPCSDWGNK